MKKLLKLLALIPSLAFAQNIRDLQGDYVSGISNFRNYVKNARPIRNALGWNTYADAAGTAPVDCTDESPTVTWTRSETTPLRPPADFNFLKDAANRQGEGVATAFTIDNADKGRVLSISFPYEVVAGTYATGDVTVWVYDVTNAALIQPAPSQIQSLASGVNDKWQGTFQAASNSTSYRLCLHVSTTSASTYTLAATDFTVGPQNVAQGSPVSSWESVTLTGSLTTNVTYTGLRRRVGDQLDINGAIGFTGANTQGAVTVTVPGCTIDTAKLPTITGNADLNIGLVTVFDNGTDNYTGRVRYNDTTSVILNLHGDDAITGTQFLNPVQINTSTNTPMTFANGDRITFRFSVPCVGWSSQAQMSSEADTRVISFSAYKPSGEAVTANTTNIAYTSIKDSHGAWNGTQYVTPAPGDYELTVGGAANGTTGVHAYVDGTLAAEITSFNSSTNSNGTVALYNLRANQLISVRSGSSVTMSGSAGTTNPNRLVIRRLTGPSQVFANELVAARYTSAAGQSIANAATPIVDFATKVFDTHNAVTTGASWKFTAPVSGTYRICERLRWANSLAWTQGGFVNAQLFKGGVAQNTIGEEAIQTSFTASTGPTAQGCDLIYLLQNEYIDIRASHNESAARALLAGATHVWINIERIGF